MSYIEWMPRAAGLAQTLTDDGVLHDPLLRLGVQAVPRHALVPMFFEQHGPAMSWREVRGEDPLSTSTGWTPCTPTHR